MIVKSTDHTGSHYKVMAALEVSFPFILTHLNGGLQMCTTTVSKRTVDPWENKRSECKKGLTRRGCSQGTGSKEQVEVKTKCQVGC